MKGVLSTTLVAIYASVAHWQWAQGFGLWHEATLQGAPPPGAEMITCLSHDLN